MLIKAAIGNERFELGASFRNALGEVLQMNIPAEAFFAIDYHLDWIYVAIAPKIWLSLSHC